MKLWIPKTHLAHTPPLSQARHTTTFVDVGVLLKECGPTTVGTLESPFELQDGGVPPGQLVQVHGAVMDRQGRMVNVGDFVALATDNTVSAVQLQS